MVSFRFRLSAAAQGAAGTLICERAENACAAPRGKVDSINRRHRFHGVNNWAARWFWQMMTKRATYRIQAIAATDGDGRPFPLALALLLPLTGLLIGRLLLLIGP